jgi:hypothetical protein
MTGQQPYSSQCGKPWCDAIKLSTTPWCLAHAAKDDPDAFDAELARISEEGTVDARGLLISAELLQQLLAAAPREHDRTALKRRFAPFGIGVA